MRFEFNACVSGIILIIIIIIIINSIIINIITIHIPANTALVAVKLSFFRIVKEMTYVAEVFREVNAAQYARV
jgi:hypothetical protein